METQIRVYQQKGEGKNDCINQSPLNQSPLTLFRSITRKIGYKEMKL